MSARASRPERESRPELGSNADLDEPFKVGKERVINRFEREYLEKLMSWASGNVSRAARRAKIDRMYLHRLLQRYALKPDSQPDE
jgi:DNA-binding NtrC family response regulator